ncbi:MAG: type II toxin-antitoxin system RelE/ParE family toxin [Hydrococcus sp. RU_2_2]|nr:type II toxin-antitoxin system RelE/ParE family toxin [Hydrococcus sp. RU_2_2]
MLDKPIRWIGSSLEDLSNFPESARRKAGFQLRAIQSGEAPSDFKPMTIIGAGVEEIRIRVGDAYRIFYVAKFEEAIYVLHAFQKKTQKTSKLNIEIGQKRYQQMLQYRQSHKEGMDK